MKKTLLFGLALLSNSYGVVSAQDYVVNTSVQTNKTPESDKSSRLLSSVNLTGSVNTKAQSITTGNTTSNYQMYRELVTKEMSAIPGETLTPSFSYTGTWMHGYVYLDKGKDGAYTSNIENNVPANNSDLVSFTYYNKYNSKGTALTEQGAAALLGSPLPSFTLPTDMTPGKYRMRYIIDYNSIDAGGSSNLVKNGGAIVDVALNVHSQDVTTNVTATQGNILNSDGTALGKVPFGKDLTIKIVPQADYIFNGMTIKHGYFDGEQTISGIQQWNTIDVPAYLIEGDTYTIPAQNIDGNIEITANFKKKDTNGGNTATDYPLNFDGSTLTIARDNNDRYLKSVGILVNSKSASLPLSYSETENNKVYNNLTDDKAILVKKGSSVRPICDWVTKGPMMGYFYIDLNNDGQFSIDINEDSHTPTMNSELVSYTHINGYNSLGEAAETNSNTINFPSFTIPANLPSGVYRARLKLDWDCSDPAGRYGSNYTNNFIDANGGQIVDFLLNISDQTGKVSFVTENGNVYGTNNSSLLETVNIGEAAQTYVASPCVKGLERKSFTVKHGQRLNGPEKIKGNRQWTLENVDNNATSFKLENSKVDGDIEVTATFGKEGTDYTLAFVDEFNGKNGIGYDKSKWGCSTRYASAWNRFITDTIATVFQQNGNMIFRTIENLDKEKDNVAMLSGAIQSRGKFAFTHGYLECRAKTNPFSGNFPAIWLMPEDDSDGWPKAGEIDIFEQINTEDKAYQTVHSHWTYDLGNKSNPSSSNNVSSPQDRYHTYGLLKEDGKITWYIDGVAKYSYARQDGNANALANGQWPFEKAFYIILNQSVGNGSWAANPNTKHIYEFAVDWVRVYLPNTITAVNNIKQENDNSSNKIYSIDGRCVNCNKTNGLTKGLYLVGNKKILVVK